MDDVRKNSFAASAVFHRNSNFSLPFSRFVVILHLEEVCARQLWL